MLNFNRLVAVYWPSLIVVTDVLITTSLYLGIWQKILTFAWTISDAIFPLPVPSNSTPNVHSLSLWKIFDRPSSTLDCHFGLSNLRPRAFAWTISDAKFPLPVPSNSTPSVHSLSLWKILIARPTYRLSNLRRI